MSNVGEAVFFGGVCVVETVCAAISADNQFAWGKSLVD